MRVNLRLKRRHWSAIDRVRTKPEIEGGSEAVSVKNGPILNGSCICEKTTAICGSYDVV
jgi:hypothetical protein